MGSEFIDDDGIVIFQYFLSLNTKLWLYLQKKTYISFWTSFINTL